MHSSCGNQAQIRLKQSLEWVSKVSANTQFVENTTWFVQPWTQISCYQAYTFEEYPAIWIPCLQIAPVQIGPAPFHIRRMFQTRSAFFQTRTRFQTDKKETVSLQFFFGATLSLLPRFFMDSLYPPLATKERRWIIKGSYIKECIANKLVSCGLPLLGYRFCPIRHFWT